MNLIEGEVIMFLSPEKIDEVISNFFKDYMDKSGFSKAFVAVSGGVDSATILYLCCKILGSDNVIAAFLPSSLTSQESKDYAFKIIEILKIKKFYDINIDKFIQPFIDLDESLRENHAKSKLRKGNIMARIRMILSYDIAAKHDALVIGTENKTEYLLGYSTQWGDSAAAIHPMGDIYKTEVFSYAKFLNVPQQIINRTPTAELWENQTDEGEIGLRYKNIDQILFYLYEKNLSPQEVINKGFNQEDVDKIINIVQKSEFKRRLPLSASFKSLRIFG